MTALDLFALVVLLIIAAVVVAVIYFLASWPGRVAHRSNHPDARAIEIGGWATLVFGGVFWPLVLMWAYRTPPPAAAERANDSAELRRG